MKNNKNFTADERLTLMSKADRDYMSGKITLAEYKKLKRLYTPNFARTILEETLLPILLWRKIQSVLKRH